MSDLKLPDFALVISAQLKLSKRSVKAALALLDDGNTIPFIARYRKEATDLLDETQLREIANSYQQYTSLHERKVDIVRLLDEQGAFAEASEKVRLMKAVNDAETRTQLDDIYRPYRPKRKTRASVAKERGLQPFSDWLLENRSRTVPEVEVLDKARRYVSIDKGVGDPTAVLQGAMDIIAEWVADDAGNRQWLRRFTYRHGILTSVAKDASVESVYELYYHFHESLRQARPHRILAINRGEQEGILRVSVFVDNDAVTTFLKRQLLQNVHEGNYVAEILQTAVEDAYKRLLAPAIERDVRAELTAEAERQAIHIFGENLSQLLMQKPFSGRVVLGVDPAYRTGCKLAVVDDTGKLLGVSVIYPTPPESRVEAAKVEVLRLLEKYHVTLIAIGNGTASRETESFIANCIQEAREWIQRDIAYLMVSEAGASVYSASPLAREEFPQLDVSERSAISIARRVQDPLAELVKIDPKSVGVGQYQHDVSQKKLDDQLKVVVETAVNNVGVDLNTASVSLLSYVAGLNKTVAKNIVDYREEKGRFRTRQTLSKVPRLGPKTLEQCVGFLRITDGDDVLDATPIHPESYTAVRYLLTREGEEVDILRHPSERSAWLARLRQMSLAILSEEAGVGEPTIRDILTALERPGRDPREDIPAPILRTDVLKLEDLEVGMELTGTVRNVVDFGAFVDIGVKNDGLVHISQLANHYVRHPLDVVSVGDVVKVRVIQVDVAKGRLGLSMKSDTA